MELEVLKAADLLRAEGLLQHCLESFRGGMTVATAVEELVWAHQEGPAEAREMATDFFVRNRKAIRVRVCDGCDDDVVGRFDGALWRAFVHAV